MIRTAMLLLIYLPSLFFSQSFSVYNEQENSRERYFNHPELFTDFSQKTSFENYKLDSILTYNIFNEPSSKVFLNYDMNNNLTRSLISLNYDSYWENSFLDEYTYDFEGNLILEQNFDWNNEKWNPHSRTLTEYNDLNEITLRTFQVLENDAWINSSRSSYEYYDDQGFRLETIERWNNDDWSNDTRILRYLTDQDHPDSLIFKSWEDDNWINHLKTVYNFNENFVSDDSIFVSAWKEGNWENYLVMEITKDDHGRKIDELEKIWDGGEWINDIQRFYDYLDDSDFIEYTSCRIWETDHWAKGYTPLLFDLSNDIIIGFITHKARLFYSIFPTGIQYDKFNNNSFSLDQNYPNPFNPSTTIKYTIPNLSTGGHYSMSSRAMPVGRQEGKVLSDRGVSVTLKVYDILGRVVATLVNTKQKPGNYEVTWNAGNLPSGVYIYKLSTGSLKQTKKMILLR